MKIILFLVCEKGDNIQFRKMKIIQKIRGHHHRVGMELIQSTRIASVNRKLILGFILFVLGITLCILFLLYSTEIITEHIQCICIISLLIEIGLCFVAMALQRGLLFNYIVSLEELLNKSECNVLIQIET